MRFFDLYGSPKMKGGDLEGIDYLFLGDYIDRGKFPLEIIRLMALKIKHKN